MVIMDYDLQSNSEFVNRRLAMVESQLRRRGIDDVRVLSAMTQVPREIFVPAALQSEAYDDCALPIGYGQTISQPFTVAFMIQALELTGAENVLDIGTGSGYAAAILALLARSVVSLEIIPELANAARERLIGELGLQNVRVNQADGTIGWPDSAPYDAIVVAAGGLTLPAPLSQQLAEGGRIVIPLGDQQSQTLCRFTKTGSRLQCDRLGAFTFVPLVGEHGWER